jgi:hypothetical protein
VNGTKQKESKSKAISLPRVPSKMSWFKQARICCEKEQAEVRC